TSSGATAPIRRSSFGGCRMSRDQRYRARRGGPSSFRCRHCGLDVSIQAVGTAHRNHCPNCLSSRHLDDDAPGDRAADCGSLMEPIAISVRATGEWVLVHRCGGGDTLHLNRTAGDDNPPVLLPPAGPPPPPPPLP